MFEWVLLSDVDRYVHRIYNTLWAYKIKMHADLTFNKLNPRWCLKGGGMDRSVYKAHGETLRMVTFRIILACKAGYWDFFAEFLLDCSNAFQSTRTDGKDSHEPDLYCWPAPGFERRAPNGERMVCKVLVGMQGRIDATRMFTQRLFKMLSDAGVMRTLWDSQLCIYHSGPLINSDASLIEKLKAITSTEDSGPQQPPNGYAMMGWHVDDSTGLACDANRQLDYTKNRVVLYVQGTIQVVYATTMTGWHGNKALGFLLECCAVEKRVTLSAPDMIDQVGEALLKDCVVITPKHIMTEDFDDIPAGVVPAVDDPMYKSVLADNALCRHAIGVYTYASIGYPHLVMPNSVLGKNAAFPHCRTLKGLRHMAMHLRANKRSASYCTYGVVGLQRSEDAELIAPHGVRYARLTCMRLLMQISRATVAQVVWQCLPVGPSTLSLRISTWRRRVHTRRKWLRPAPSSITWCLLLGHCRSLASCRV